MIKDWNIKIDGRDMDEVVCLFLLKQCNNSIKER